MNKIIIITGLTASGKSEIAIKTAKKYNGAIISADSVQIYKGLNIGSAKENIEIRNEIPHYLIDIKDFNEDYDVGQFLHDCDYAIKGIISKGQLPIIVGGTGLYIKALLEGYSLGNVRADMHFRDKFQKIARERGREFVWNELYKLNPQKAQTVHPNNLNRVIRYLELELNNQTENKHESKTKILDGYDVLCLAIIDNREEIYDKINKRVDRMIASGLENEVADLIKNGANREMHSMNSIGYKEWFDSFEGKQNLLDTINLIKQHSRNYCKRQMTFLKTIKGVDLCSKSEAEERIKEFMND